MDIISLKAGPGCEPYSYRGDPTVPEFDDTGPVVVMDGECVLCSVGARLISRFDKAEEFRICRVQSALGRSLLSHYGIAADDPESWLYIAEGRAYTSMDAMIRVGAKMGGIGLALQPLRLLPGPAQDWVYRRIARNRYRLFGRTDMCSLPDPALRARLME
jgi:predicted DCC family thiol-disulfide oxidoreductase YuxK